MNRKRVVVFDRIWDENHKCKKVFKELAWFHQFGVDYEEFEDGPCAFSVAIIELQNGKIEPIPVDLIQFIDQPPALSIDSSEVMRIFEMNPNEETSETIKQFCETIWFSNQLKLIG